MYKSNNCQPEPMVECPFNKEHVFFKSRLQHHIIKCSKNYPNHHVCPYNALHRFLKREDFAAHVLCCPDISFTLSLKQEKQGSLKETPFHHDNIRAFNKELEDWDAEYQ